MSTKTETFIRKARTVHGDKYDYSKVCYHKALEKVDIICREHGVFSQTPNNHLRGKGCRACNGHALLDTESFIRKARAVHGDKYDYTPTVYTNANEKLVIRCRKHGEFKQIPYSHMIGKGCMKCRAESTSELKTLSLSDFITISNKTHNHRYDYSKSEYVSSKRKVTITCHKHGDFTQQAGSHMRGSGCPSCMFRRATDSHVYILESDHRVKIGVTTDPRRRFKTLTEETPFDFSVSAVWASQGIELAYSIEKMLHDHFKEFNSGLSGFDGATEWFNVPASDVAGIINTILGDPLE